MFFSIYDKSAVKSFDFLEEFGTLYNLLIYLLNNSIRIISSTKAQTEFLEATTALKIIISSIKADVTNQSEEEKNKIFVERENVLSNAKMLFIKRGELIKQFSKNNTISKNAKFYDAPKESEESISEKSEQKSDQLIPKWVQVSEKRSNSIKFKINMNKSLATTTDKERYTLNDANELINKIAEKRLVKIMPLKHTIIW